MSPTPLVPGTILTRLPVFPLPEVVLFPGAALPLHIFEPRYLAMLDLVLRTDKKMGVVQLAPGWEPDYFGAPRFASILGVGEILHHEPAPEGRANVVLRGVGRVRVLREIKVPVAFRMIEAEVLPDVVSSGEEASVERDMALVRQLVASFVARLPERVRPELAQIFVPGDPPGVVLDRICGLLPAPPPVRQALLEAIAVERRAELLVEVLSGFSVRTGEVGGDEES